MQEKQAPGRRRFLALGAGAAVIGGGERLVGGAAAAPVQRDRAAGGGPAAAPGRRGRAGARRGLARVSGITPFFTSNTASTGSTPTWWRGRSRRRDWTLQITGMVDHPIELSFDDLLSAAADRART